MGFFDQLFQQMQTGSFTGNVYGMPQQQQHQQRPRSQALMEGRKLFAYGAHGEPVYEIQALAVRTHPEDQQRRRP